MFILASIEYSKGGDRHLKKTLRISLLTVALMVFLVGWGVQAADDKPLKGVTITFAVQSMPTMTKAIAMLPQFTEETGINVKVDLMPYDSLVQKITIDLTTGTKQYDVFWMEPTWLGRFKNDFEPIDRFINDPKIGIDLKDFDPVFFEQTQEYDGKIYGLPFDACLLLLAYREDVYEELGLKVPETWEEYLENVKIIDAKSNVRGVSLMGKRGQPVFYEFLPYFWGFGGEFFDDNMKPALNTPEGVKALEYMVELSKYAPAGVPTFGWEESATEFLQGRAAHAFIFSDWVPALKDPASCTVTKTWNFMKTPKGPSEGSPVGTINIGINKDISEEKKQAAYLLLKWITGYEVQKELAVIGGAPSRLSVLNDPAFATEEFRYFKAIKETFPIEKVPMKIPEFFKLNEALSVQLSSALSGEKTPKKALDDAQKSWEEIMKEAGY